MPYYTGLLRISWSFRRRNGRCCFRSRSGWRHRFGSWRFYLRRRSWRGRRGLGSNLSLALLEQLKKSGVPAIAQAALMAFDHARVATGPVGKAGCDLAEELLD